MYRYISFYVGVVNERRQLMWFACQLVAFIRTICMCISIYIYIHVCIMGIYIYIYTIIHILTRWSWVESPTYIVDIYHLSWYHIPSSWINRPSQQPQFEVPTIYKAYVRAMFFGKFTTKYGQKYGSNGPPYPRIQVRSPLILEFLWFSHCFSHGFSYHGALIWSHVGSHLSDFLGCRVPHDAPPLPSLLTCTDGSSERHIIAACAQQT